MILKQETTQWRHQQRKQTGMPNLCEASRVVIEDRDGAAERLLVGHDLQNTDQLQPEQKKFVKRTVGHNFD